MKSISIQKSHFQAFSSPSLLASTSLRSIRQEELVEVEVAFASAALEGEVQNYDWRLKTEFPIIKIYDYRIVKRDCLKTVMVVSLERYRLTLQNLKDLPLFKLLYLLKEAIIGFERLYAKFGPFRATPKMVALNPRGKCKIWLCQNFASNAAIPSQMTEAAFLQSICGLFVGAANKLKNTVTFLRELLQLQSFCQALTFIENYARENKISIQTCLRVHQREVAVVQSKPPANFNPSLTMARSPSFLTASNLRASLKPGPKINILNLATSKMIQEGENGQGNMKTSGDTADCKGSGLASSQAEVEVVDNSIIFGEERREGRGEWSRFNKSDNMHSKLSRCLSPNAYISHAHSGKHKEVSTPNHRTNFRLRQEEEPEENDNFLSQSVASVFNKNKWEKKLDGLFGCEQVLKKSSHEGQERRREQLSAFKLELLGSIGKNIRESFSHDDHVLPYTSQF